MALLPGPSGPPKPISLLELARDQILQDPRRPKAGSGLTRAAIVSESIRRLLASDPRFK